MFDPGVGHGHHADYIDVGDSSCCWQVWDLVGRSLTSTSDTNIPKTSPTPQNARGEQLAIIKKPKSR